MTEINDLSPPQAAASTVLDDRKHEEKQNPTEGLDTPQEKPGSTRDAIAKAFDEVAGKSEEKEEAPAKVEKVEKTDDKADAKPAEKVEAKVEKAKEQPVEGEKSAAPAKDDAGDGQDGDKKSRQSEGRPFYEPPARFLPKEKEAWANVPNVVKSAVDRLAKEHEQEVTQYRQAHEEWTKLSKFDQMAKQHGVTVADALERYTAVDGLLKSNPIEGIRRVLETVGITPQQYAEFIVKNPQAAQAPVQRAPDPMVQQTSSEVQALKAELENMKLQQAAQTIIEPFKRDHPRYDELEGDIAFFLESGKIPQSLSPTERLEAAYDMAERINPRSMPAVQQPFVAPASEPEEPVVDPRGTKSIKGAPSGGFEPSETGRVKSRRSAVTAAMAEHGLL